MSDTLSPPKRINTEDPGAHELVESDSEEHFSDAQSMMTPTPTSPIPRTRVEKVSDEPSYGEIPGTDAYRLRVGDAAPDEIAIIPDERGGKGASSGDDEREAEGSAKEGQRGSETSRPESPLPGGQPIPVTVVEQAAGSVGPHSEEFVKKRQADAPPDVVVNAKAVGAARKQDSVVDSKEHDDGPEPPALTISPPFMSPVSAPSPQFLASPGSPGAPPSTQSDLGHDGGSEFHTSNDVAREGSLHGDVDDPVHEDASKIEPSHDTHDAQERQKNAEDGSSTGLFGDDFDEFEEGVEDDFDDFGDGDFQEPAPAQAPPPREPAPRPQPTRLPYPIPDFDGLERDEISSVLESYLALLFPPEKLVVPELPALGKNDAIFSTPRSASLWSQLVAPPPLSPPDWIRSRIRRAFLVSLGVPVDLDEILPASKQKKLVLPSLAATVASSRGGSPRASSDLRSVARLKYGDANASSTSVDSQGNLKKGRSASKARRGRNPEPEFDLVSARQLCTTTSEALDGMTDQELKEHVGKLDVLHNRSREALEYWQKRADGKIGDREAFEGVIENLVKHARKVRK